MVMAECETAQEASSPDGSGISLEVREFVTFGLGDEEYAVDIAMVREIRSFSASTPIPEAPTYVLGVVNLRGSVVPIMDLRERFGQGFIEPGVTTVVVILEFAGRTVGLVVDAVSDILRTEVTNIQPAPEYDHSSRAKGVDSLIIQGDRLIGILSLEHILGDFLNGSAIKEAA
jgi:purine-binding chemotaxis protein CheW